MFVISKILLLRDDTLHTSAMKLFSWIGILFVLIGLVKLFIKLNKNGFFKAEQRVAEKLSGSELVSSSLEERNKARKLEQQQLERQRLDQQRKGRLKNNQNLAEQDRKPSIVICPVCKTRNYSTSNFCHICGQRLKK